jgi:hypothetical protein
MKERHTIDGNMDVCQKSRKRLKEIYFKLENIMNKL